MTKRTSLVAVGIALIPSIAFVLHDFVFQLPDNQHEASPGFFLTVFGLLAVWGVAGHVAAHGSRRTFTAVGAGAVAGVLSVAILWITFVALNSFFTDRMSYEPDRIRAFEASGYPTMKDYLDHQRGAGPFPLLMGVAAVAGLTGGSIRKRHRHT